MHIAAARRCSALRGLLPSLQQRQVAPAADEWDSLLLLELHGGAGALASAVAGGGRCMQLRCLVWADISFRLGRRIQADCPVVMLNPMAEEVAAAASAGGRLPPAYDPAFELDAPLLAGGGGCARVCVCVWGGGTAHMRLSVFCRLHGSLCPPCLLAACRGGGELALDGSGT